MDFFSRELQTWAWPVRISRLQIIAGLSPNLPEKKPIWEIKKLQAESVSFFKNKEILKDSKDFLFNLNAKKIM
jgi:hypothetical protein